MLKKKKTAKEIVTEVIAKVDAEVTPKTVEAPKTETPQTSTHYYRCNVTLGNEKACNCSAFM